MGRQMTFMVDVQSMQDEQDDAMDRHETGHLESQLAAIAGGSVPAFVAFHAATGAVVHASMLRIIRDPDRTDRAVVAVYVELWRNAAAFDPRRGSGAAWVLALAHGHGLAALRECRAAPVTAAALDPLPPDHHRLLALALEGTSRAVAGARPRGFWLRLASVIRDGAQRVSLRAAVPLECLSLCTPAHGAIPRGEDNRSHDK